MIARAGPLPWAKKTVPPSGVNAAEASGPSGQNDSGEKSFGALSKAPPIAFAVAANEQTRSDIKSAQRSCMELRL